MSNRQQRRLAERKGHPVNVNGQPVNQAQALIRQESYSGPMPAPEDMFRYRECSEDLPGRIMSLAEESSRRETMKVENQRQEIENQKTSLENQRAAIENQKLAIKANNMSNIIGLIFAFILSGACILASFYFVLQDKNIQAFVAAILPAAVFFKTFFAKKK